MPRKCCGLVVAVLLIFPLGVLAQGSSLIPYAWDAADLALAYPAGWDEPVPMEADGQAVLQMAQSLADSPDVRPPGIPIITVSVSAEAVETPDLAALVQSSLQAIGIAPGEAQSASLMGIEAMSASGTSSDNLLFGVARAVQLADGRTLVISGRAPASQRDDFVGLFDSVATSLVPGAGSTPILPAYGVLWFTERTLADGETAFVNLVGAAYSPAGFVYTVDPDIGVIQLNALSGYVLATYYNQSLTAPSDVAADGDGNVYIGDTACRCILALGANGEWLPDIGSFNESAPLSVAAGPDGTVYATDEDDAGIVLRIFRGSDAQSVLFPPDVSAQPILTVNRAGDLLAITPEGSVLALEDGQFVQQFDLSGISSAIVDAAFLSGAELAVATNEGVMIVNTRGEELDRLGRIVANFPLAGEVVNPSGVAASPNGTIYFVDSDGSFGAVTAMSTRVEAGRIGATSLALDVPVQGTLDQTTPEQRWTYNAIAGETVTISAVDSVRDTGLDVAVHLLAPDGSEEAFNDDQETADLYGQFDAQIPNHTFAASGAYTIVVERVDGEGAYTLGISAPRSFELSADNVTRLEGELHDVFPTQRWLFEGHAGQVFTITMQAAADTTLDPVLRLLDPNGNLVANNDDAADTALGLNAQLVQVRLPVDGQYTIEASRFDGEGQYELVIVATS